MGTAFVSLVCGYRFYLLDAMGASNQRRVLFMIARRRVKLHITTHLRKISLMKENQWVTAIVIMMTYFIFHSSYPILLLFDNIPQVIMPAPYIISVIISALIGLLFTLKEYGRSAQILYFFAILTGIIFGYTVWGLLKFFNTHYFISSLLLNLLIYATICTISTPIAKARREMLSEKCEGAD